METRAIFDFILTFANGGGLRGEGFRLDLPRADAPEEEIAGLLVAHLGLLLVEKVELRNLRRVEEPHRGSRGVPRTGAGPRRRVDLSHSLHHGLVTYPGLPAPEISDHLSREGSVGKYAPGVTFQIGRISLVANTGTYLDSLRFRFHVARHLNVSPAFVEANVLGEHGTSEVFMWWAAQVAGVPVLDAMQQIDRGADVRHSIEQEVRYANITIIEGNQASQFGIGMVSARIAEIVLRDERAVIPIGSYNPKYGVTLSIPSVAGQSGVVKILEPAMSDEERHALQRSADTLKVAVARIQS